VYEFAGTHIREPRQSTVPDSYSCLCERSLQSVSLPTVQRNLTCNQYTVRLHIVRLSVNSGLAAISHKTPQDGAAKHGGLTAISHETPKDGAAKHELTDNCTVCSTALY